ncbi:hypothetical protein GWO58_00340 [Corynebacterium macginleyi]|uniref:hypothetical protein n=1 Tax=Corynebacterium macginleyi TaxID=38290 RepID=UPI00190B683D|nr:hypothetical protein [Corynebacterium macginleyi]MBK4145347.1 hypothetical protein [Corynebacterium macginleyi]
MGKPEWLIGRQTPTHQNIPAGDREFADKACEFVRWAGLDLYPWQEELLRDSLLQNDAGMWSSREVVVSLARQNGKGEVLVALELVAIYLCGAHSIMHSAHFLDTAMDARDRLWEVIEDNPALMDWWEDEYPGVSPKPILGNGKDAIKFPNKAKIYYRTRTKKTGRGLSFDWLIFDECFDLPNEVYAAMNNTTKARPNAQKVFISSPVNIHEHFHGAIFSAKRWAALDGADGILFKEWCREEDDDPYKEATWAKANPSLVNEPRPGVQLDEVRSEANAARSSEALLEPFLVETLGQGYWVPRDGDLVDDFVPVIDYEAWSEASAMMPSSLGESCLAVDVTPDGEAVGVVSAAQWGDKVFLSLAPYEDFDRGLVVDKVGSTVELNDPAAVVLDPSGQCSTLVDPLRGIGVAPETLSGAQVSKAYELFLRMWAEKRIAHDGSQRWLDALGVAQERSKNGRFRSLDRYSGDVTILVAATLAVWGLQEYGVGEFDGEVKRRTHYVSSARGVKRDRRVAEMSF